MSYFLVHSPMNMKPVQLPGSDIPTTDDADSHQCYKTEWGNIGVQTCLRGFPRVGALSQFLLKPNQEFAEKSEQFGFQCTSFHRCVRRA